MCESSFITAVIPAVAVIVGVLIGCLVTHRLTIEKIAYDTRSEANRRLRAAFCEELALLQRKPMTGVKMLDLLDGAFVKHQIAVNEFKSHLIGGEYIAFCQSWLAYHGYSDANESHDIQFFEKFMFHNGKADQKEAIKKIQAILDFANPPRVKPWYRFWS